MPPSPPHAVLLISCADAPGIVRALASFVADHGGNILDSDQHLDRATSVFFTRLAFTLEGFRVPREEIAERVFEVELPRLELQEPRMDKEGLERVAAESGGQFLRLDGLSAIPADLPSLSEPILVRKEEEELWDKPWVFGLFLALILIEWIGRKFCRLL